MWTWTKKLIVFGGLAVFVMSGAPDAEAQIVYGQPAAGSAQVIYYHWKTDRDGDESTISQFMIPISGFLPVRDNFDLTFFVANSSSTYSAFESEYKLNGLGDFRLQANHSFADDRLLVSASVNLPIGKKELSGDQSHALFALSQNYLEFPMRQFGEGFGFNLLVGGALELTEGMRAGAGVAYQYVGGYTPYEGSVTIDTLTNDTTVIDYEGYNPGDVFSINGGVDYERGRMLWSADLVYSHYVADKLNTIKTFKQSRQFDWRFRGNYNGENIQFVGLVRYVWRGKNRLYNEAGEWAFTRKLFGNELLLSGELTYPFAEQWYAAPSADLRLIASNEVNFDNSSIMGFGAAVGRKFGESMDARFGFKLYTGSADGGNIDVSGYRVTFGLTATI